MSQTTLVMTLIRWSWCFLPLTSVHIQTCCQVHAWLVKFASSHVTVYEYKCPRTDYFLVG